MEWSVLARGARFNFFVNSQSVITVLKHVGNGMLNLKHTYRYDIKRPLLPLYSSLDRLSVFKFCKYHFYTKYQYHLFLFKKTTNTGMIPVNLPRNLPH